MMNLMQECAARHGLDPWRALPDDAYLVVTGPDAYGRPCEGHFVGGLNPAEMQRDRTAEPHAYSWQSDIVVGDHRVMSAFAAAGSWRLVNNAGFRLGPWSQQSLASAAVPPAGGEKRE